MGDAAAIAVECLQPGKGPDNVLCGDGIAAETCARRRAQGGNAIGARRDDAGLCRVDLLGRADEREIALIRDGKAGAAIFARE